MPSMMSNGYIQFTIPGGAEVRGGDWRAALKDENSIVFMRGKQADAFQQAKALIEQYQAAMRAQASAPAVAPLSPADELAKFAALRDQGIITPEDFEAKKRQLLGL
jgi:hypothetical protein